MNTTDSRTWIIVSLLLVFTIGIAIFVAFAGRASEARERAMVDRAMAVEQATRAEQIAVEHAHLEQRIRDYELQIQAYEAEIQRLKHDR